MAQDTTETGKAARAKTATPPIRCRFGMKRTMLLLRDLERHYSQSYPDMPSLRFWPREDLLRREVSVYSDRSRAIEAGRLIVSAIPEGCEIKFEVWAGHRLPMFQAWTNVSGGLFSHRALIPDGDDMPKRAAEQSKTRKAAPDRKHSGRRNPNWRAIVKKFIAEKAAGNIGDNAAWAARHFIDVRTLYNWRVDYDREAHATM